jgi:hypothetical protein
MLLSKTISVMFATFWLLVAYGMTVVIWKFDLLINFNILTKYFRANSFISCPGGGVVKRLSFPPTQQKIVVSNLARILGMQYCSF